MTTEPSRFVPKVHPASRPVEAEDPLSLHAISLEGDPELMLHCVVQEYAWMGWGSEQILNLFRDPFYPALRELWDRYGEANLRERIARLIQQTGIFHFQVTIREEPEPEEAETELVELGIPPQWRAEGLPDKSVADSLRESGRHSRSECPTQFGPRAEGGDHA